MQNRTNVGFTGRRAFDLNAVGSSRRAERIGRGWAELHLGEEDGSGPIYVFEFTRLFQYTLV